jgi:hypothetical protein
VRRTEPVTVRSPFVPTKVTVRTRPEGATFARKSATVPGTCSRFARTVALKRIGPQSWYGERVSYGSGTETRYGRGLAFAQTSWTFAVFPPELEKKYVSASSFS